MSNAKKLRRAPQARGVGPAGALTATAAGAMLLFAAAAAQAQQADGQQVTVTGIRGAIESAISVKKNADSIVESVNAEDIGKLPDTSIAESIARLPGVAAQRFQGRAQVISIRGFAPDFSTALLNGREQVSTGDSRFVEFDQYPSELLQAVNIHKTPTASLIGQGLSATVDMQLVRPLEYGRRALAVNYRKQRSGVGLDGTDEGTGSRFSLSYIDQFADRKLGIALGFARLDEDTAQTQRFEAWGVADSCPVAPNPDGSCPSATVKTPGGFNAWVDQTKQTRDAFMGVIQFKPVAEYSGTLDFFYSKFKQDKSTKGFQAPVGFTSAGGYDPSGQLTATTVTGGVATAGSFDNFKGVIRNDVQATDDKLLTLGLNNKLTMGNWTGELDLAHSKVKRTGQILETTAGLPGNGNAGGAVDTISWTGFDGTSVQGANYSTGLSYTDRNVVKLTDVQGWGGGTSTPQAGYSKLPHVEDKLDAVKISGKTDLPDGMFFNSLDVGLHYGDRKKTREYVEGRLILSTTDPFAAVTMPGSGTMIAGQSGIPIAIWDPRGSVGSIYQVAAKLVPDIANKDWSVTEKLTTPYAKLDFENKLGGVTVRGNAGLQIVHTKQESTAFNVDGQACINDVCPTRPNTLGADYYDILPSANLTAELGGGQLLRLGLGRQMARPVLNDLRASLQFGVDANNGAPLLKGSAGNPELKPYRATALDVSYEKYFGNKVYLAAAGFYKHLSSYILKEDVLFDYGPYVAAGTPLPTTGPFAGSTIGLLNRPVNGSGGNIRGVELAGSVPFGMMTDALEGFGVQASYSYTTSSVNLPTSGFANDSIQTSTIPLPGLSKKVSGLTFYFERWGFSARVAQRYRSDFVGEITDIVGDRKLTFIKAERVTDLQLGYEFDFGPVKGLGIVLQVNNLGDAEYVRYKDTPSNEVERTKYGKTYLFGLNYKL